MILIKEVKGDYGEFSDDDLWINRVATAGLTLDEHHPGSRWADPDVQAQRRAEAEKENAQMATYHDQAAKDEEARIKSASGSPRGANPLWVADRTENGTFPTWPTDDVGFWG